MTLITNRALAPAATHWSVALLTMRMPAMWAGGANVSVLMIAVPVATACTPSGDAPVTVAVFVNPRITFVFVHVYVADAPGGMVPRSRSQAGVLGSVTMTR